MMKCMLFYTRRIHNFLLSSIFNSKICHCDFFFFGGGGCYLTVLQKRKKERKEKKTDREQKAWGLIRTATGIVAKLISQKEIGLHSISVSAEKPISQGSLKVNSHATGCLTSTAMIAESQVKFTGARRSLSHLCSAITPGS